MRLECPAGRRRAAAGPRLSSRAAGRGNERAAQAARVARPPAAHPGDEPHEEQRQRDRPQPVLEEAGHRVHHAHAGGARRLCERGCAARVGAVARASSRSAISGADAGNGPACMPAQNARARSGRSSPPILLVPSSCAGAGFSCTGGWCSLPGGSDRRDTCAGAAAGASRARQGLSRRPRPRPHPRVQRARAGQACSGAAAAVALHMRPRPPPMPRLHDGCQRALSVGEAPLGQQPAGRLGHEEGQAQQDGKGDGRHGEQDAPAGGVEQRVGERRLRDGADRPEDWRRVRRREGRVRRHVSCLTQGWARGGLERARGGMRGCPGTRPPLTLDGHAKEAAGLCGHHLNHQVEGDLKARRGAARGGGLGMRRPRRQAARRAVCARARAPALFGRACASSSALSRATPRGQSL